MVDTSDVPRPLIPWGRLSLKRLLRQPSLPMTGLLHGDRDHHHPVCRIPRAAGPDRGPRTSSDEHNSTRRPLRSWVEMPADSTRLCASINDDESGKPKSQMVQRTVGRRRTWFERQNERRRIQFKLGVVGSLLGSGNTQDLFQKRDCLGQVRHVQRKMKAKHERLSMKIEFVSFNANE